MSLKFAIQIENQFGYTWDRTRRIIEDTEKYGYESFYICDHFLLDKDAEDRHALEAYTVLTAAATITNKIKLGSLVTGNNYRNPALLAKIAASIDHISRGRMEFGIGAGWKEVEYKMYGYDYPSVGDRMDMLEESIQIIKKLFTEKRATFEGKHFRVEDAIFSPKPDNPLFLIGGGGEKRTLKLVAKYADYCNLFGLPKKDLDRKLEALKGHCKDVGRDYDDVGKSLFTSCILFETEEEAEKAMRERADKMKISFDELQSRINPSDIDGSWIGTPEQVRDRIEFMQNNWDFDYFFLQQPFEVEEDIIETFAVNVKDKYFK